MTSTAVHVFHTSPNTSLVNYCNFIVTFTLVLQLYLSCCVCRFNVRLSLQEVEVGQAAEHHKHHLYQ